MKKRNLLPMLVLGLFVLSAFGYSVMLANAQEDDCEEPVFEIHLLSPNSIPARTEWANLMQQEFPKACIGIASHLNTGWPDIYERTFSSPDAAPGGLPGFADGGFDVLFVGYAPSAPDVDPRYYGPDWFLHETGGYDYQYWGNTTQADLAKEYVGELDATKRTTIGNQIQEIWHEELPSISLLEDLDVWAYSEDITLSANELRMLTYFSLGDRWKDFAITGADTLNYAQGYQHGEFVPFVQDSYIAAFEQDLIWQGLYQRNLETLLFEPLIASAAPVWNDDFTEAVVTMKDTVKFADGDAVTAADVVRSYHMFMTPAFQADGYATLTYYFDTNSSVAATGDYEITFTMEEPFYLAESLFSYPILPKTWGNNTHIADWVQNGYDYNSEAGNNTQITTSAGLMHMGYGTGPFMFDDIEGITGDMRMVANPNYWNGDVELAAVQFLYYSELTAALTDLGADVVQMIDSKMGPEIPEIEALTGVTHTEISSGGWQEIAVNMAHPILGTGEDTPLGQDDPSRAAEAAKYVRKAISHAIPRQTIIDEILDGLADPGIVPGFTRARTGHNTALQPYEYDVDKAREFLAMAGYDEAVAGGFLPIADLLPLTIAAFAVGVAFVRKSRRN